MHHLGQHIISFIFVVLVLLLIAIWGLSPLLMQATLKDFFQQYNARFTVGSISVNPFTSTVSASDIKVTSKRGKELELATMQFELAILPLFERKIRIIDMTVDELQLQVERKKQYWRIAGLRLSARQPPKDNDPGDSKPETTEAWGDETTTIDPGNLWYLHLTSVMVNNSAISVHLADISQAESASDDIKINRLYLSEAEGQYSNWRGAATLSAVINGATADLSTEFRYQDGDLTQWLDVQLITAALSQFRHHLPEPFDQGNLNLSLIGELVVNRTATGTVVTASTQRLQLDRMALPMQPLSIESERTEASITSLQIVFPVNESPTILLEGQLNSTMTRITTDEDQKLVAAWDELRINPVVMRAGEAESLLRIATLEINQLTTSQNSSREAVLPALADVKALIIRDLALTDQQLTIDTVDIADLSLHLQLDKDRKLTTLVTLSGQNLPTSATNQPSRSLPGRETDNSGRTRNRQPYSVAINRLTVTGDSVLDVVDLGIDPVFSQRVNINLLTVEGVNTSNPDQAMHVVLQAQTGKTSVIESDTRIWPLQQALTTDTRTQLQAFSLPSVSPYLAPALGYGISSGELDMRLALTIDQGLIDGQSSVRLRNFDITETTNHPLGSHKSLNAAKQLPERLPLSKAVAMLKQGKDGIELDMPISGNVNNPQFTWVEFISLQLENALHEAAANIERPSLKPK